MKHEIFSTGKLPQDVLRELIKYSGVDDKQVIVGPRVGEDCAVVDFDPNGEFYLVLKTDPITFATDEIGYYCVNVNANDVLTTGALPQWMQVTILLPEKTTNINLAETIFKQLHDAATKIGVSIVGGHTEITYGIDRPIVVGSMHGLVKKDRLILTSTARVGDDIVLTKGAGIEGTSIIAREKESELLKVFSKDFVERAKNYLYEPGISIKPEAVIASELGVNAMHDPTEGGVLQGLYELASASNKGLIVYEDKIIINEETRILCEQFDLNPLGLISSGSLLVTLNPNKTESYLKKLTEQGIKASVIGKITGDEHLYLVTRSGKKIDLPHSEIDEIVKIF